MQSKPNAYQFKKTDARGSGAIPIKQRCSPYNEPRSWNKYSGQVRTTAIRLNNRSASYINCCTLLCATLPLGSFLAAQLFLAQTWRTMNKLSAHCYKLPSLYLYAFFKDEHACNFPVFAHMHWKNFSPPLQSSMVCGWNTMRRLCVMTFLVKITFGCICKYAEGNDFTFSFTPWERCCSGMLWENVHSLRSSERERENFSLFGTLFDRVSIILCIANIAACASLSGLGAFMSLQYDVFCFQK
jgi:hypothetical protein